MPSIIENCRFAVFADARRSVSEKRRHGNDHLSNVGYNALFAVELSLQLLITLSIVAGRRQLTDFIGSKTIIVSHLIVGKIGVYLYHDANYG